MEPNPCFGVGLVPYGRGRPEQWSLEGFSTGIQYGVQYFGELNLAQLFRSATGKGEAMRRTVRVMEDASCRNLFTNRPSTLDDIQVRIERPPPQRSKDSVTVMTVQHGKYEYRVEYPRNVDENLQLYLNCFSWPDNMTSIRLESVELVEYDNLQDDDDGILSQPNI